MSDIQQQIHKSDQQQTTWWEVRHLGPSENITQGLLSGSQVYQPLRHYKVFIGWHQGAFYVGTPCEEHLFDHRLWPIFQSSIFTDS